MKDYINDAFTREGNNTNLEVNNLNVGCITSTNNAFELDSNGNLTVNNLNAKAVNSLAITNAIYPVGSIYLSVIDSNPSVLFGGQWEQLKDRFLIGCGNTYENGATGGEANVQLKNNNIPSDFIISTSSGVNKTWCTGHWDNYSGYAYPTTNIGSTNLGSNQPHNNMPPYLSVYMWKRIG